MTRREAIAKLNEVGINMEWHRDHSEYRVNYWCGREATAYYTDNMQDAYDTGMAMAKAGPITKS